MRIPITCRHVLFSSWIKQLFISTDLIAFFSGDCDKVIGPCFSSFAHAAPRFPLSRQKIILNKTFILVSYGVVVYKVEKSNHAMDVPRFLRLLIEFITG